MTADITLIRKPALASFDGEQLVTFRVDDQHFGIPALKVRDVLQRQPITRVPLAPAEIAGAINLRGHIVTAINMRTRLVGPKPDAEVPSMCVVVESRGEAFCLLVDAVGDVLTVNEKEILPNPGSLPPTWAEMSRGVYRLNDSLLLLLDVDQLLTWSKQ